MPAADLTPGFFGKIPATGDFVNRRLPASFVGFWDRFCTHHLVPLLIDGRWDRDDGLCFLLGPLGHGPMAGIVLPSADRVGRRFPLTVAAPAPVANAGIPASASPWFDAVCEVARRARDGTLDADDLAAELAALPFPADAIPGTPVRALLVWTNPSELHEAEFETPRSALDQAFGFTREVG